MEHLNFLLVQLLLSVLNKDCTDAPTNGYYRKVRISTQSEFLSSEIVIFLLSYY